MATQPVDEVCVAVELVLDDVVEDLEEEEDEVVVGRRGEEEPGRGKGLEQVEQLAGRDHRHRLDVGRDVAQDGQQAVEERLQPLDGSQGGDSIDIWALPGAIPGAMDTLIATATSMGLKCLC